MQLGSPNLTYIQMFLDESWKPIYFEVNRSKVTKVTTSVLVFRQNAIVPLLRTYATLGFPCCNVPPHKSRPALACRWTPGFSRRGFFCTFVSASSFFWSWTIVSWLLVCQRQLYTSRRKLLTSVICVNENQNENEKIWNENDNNADNSSLKAALRAWNTHAGV